MENTEYPKTVIAGFGNILMGDEGVGVRVAQELARHYDRQSGFSPEIIDGGTAGFDVLLSLRKVDRLIIIDAVRGEGPAGTIYRFDYAQVRARARRQADSLSLHDLNLLEALSLAEKLGELPPDIVFIGIEPETMEFKMELSETVKQKLPEAVRIVMKEVDRDCITAEAN